MQDQMDQLKLEHHKLDKALAVCVTRIDRSEREVKDLSSTVHDTKATVVEIKVKLEKQETLAKEQFAAAKQQFVTLSSQHSTMLDEVKELAKHVLDNTESNLKVRTVYKTVTTIAAGAVVLLGVAVKLDWL